MPTKRAWTILAYALALYLLANQTQVGWVYIISSALVGLLAAAFLYGRWSLRSLRLERTFAALSQPTTRLTEQRYNPLNDADLSDPTLLPLTIHEDDPIRVTLRVTQTGLRPVFLVSGLETCPFAPAAEQEQPFFLSTIFHNQPVELSYETSCDRRGLHSFPAIRLASAGPFGLFGQRRTLPPVGELLIYPAYHPLKRLRLLENRAVADQRAMQVGIGSEVIGTREYRPGDTLRQIHWRSTARTGALIVKEFAAENQQTLTIILDLDTAADFGQGKYSAFETAVRIAASLAYYATKEKIPFYFLASGSQQPLPTALSWWSGLNYLARVNNAGTESLADFLDRLTLPAASFTVVLVTRSDEATVKTLQRLQRKGEQILPIFITPAGELPDTARTLKMVVAVSPHHWVEALERL